MALDAEKISDMHEAAGWLAERGRDSWAGAISEAACLLDQNSSDYVLADYTRFTHGDAKTAADCINDIREDLREIANKADGVADYIDTRAPLDMTVDEAAEIIARLYPIGGTSRECQALSLYVKAIHSVKDREIDKMRSALERLRSEIDEALNA